MCDVERIVTRLDMTEAAREAQGHGLRIVFTNGCFDILHAGHVTYLANARSLGDRLFIGVNSDRSVRGIKGAGRPLNREGDRALLLAALRHVDLVTIFDEETASELVEAVKPDIYVKGGDYSSDATSPAYPIEGDVVARYGGSVHIVPFADGYSTTGLIDRLRTLAS